MKKILYLGIPLIALFLLAQGVFAYGNDLYVRGNIKQGGTINVFGYAAPNTWVAIQVNSPIGVYFVDQIKANQYGYFKTQFTLANNAPTGTYKIYVASKYRGTRKVYFYLFPKKQEYNPADINQDCKITDTELINYINLWQKGDVSTTQLIRAIRIWRTFKPYC